MHILFTHAHSYPPIFTNLNIRGYPIMIKNLFCKNEIQSLTDDATIESPNLD
jgi:hypothetical protein